LAVLEQLSLITRPEHIGDIEKCSALDLGTQVHKGSLHTRKHPRDLAAVDVSDHSSVTFTLNKKLSEGSLFNDRYAGLGSLCVDHEQVLHESSAICCDRSGAPRHPCRKSGSLGVG